MVEIKSLTKSYNGHNAVDDLTITVEEGQIYGFLGPNGAGKSTTMNIMTGCLAATSGSVKIGGFDILKQPKEAKKCIGYLPEQPPLYLDMTPREYLRFACGLKGIKGADIEKEIAKVAGMTQIEDHLDRLIKHLSKGYKQRVGIAQAVLGDPKLIILDEPTVGLDPKQITEIRELIRALGKKHTVILSSHILSEISSVCDKIMILRKGKLVACDTPENLSAHALNETTLTLCADPCGADLSTVGAKINGLSSFSTSPSKEEAGCIDITVSYKPELDLRREVSKAVTAKGAIIVSMTEVRMSLEDIFLELTDSSGEPVDSQTDDAAQTDDAVQTEAPAQDQKPDEGGDRA
ncbi:MAG: ABC transporter ATP-binding protein [Clostridiaceae bacterium]|nr:ABC transporter ATP-binding protein [Clostridiaceae bacterium]